ncbi:unnamed protein product [Aphanomyces euteiches]
MAAAANVAYEVFDVEIDKSYKGVKKVERVLSSIALDSSTPSLYIADASSSLHAFTLNSERSTKFHQQLKKIYHENIHIIDSWSSCATIVDSKLTMLSLPLSKDSGTAIIEETRGITSLSVQEHAHVLCCLVKQNLMVYDWSVQARRLQLRSSHDLTDKVHVAVCVLCLGSGVALVHFKRKIVLVDLDTGVQRAIPLSDPVLFASRVEGKHETLDNVLMATKDYGMILRWDTESRRAVVDGRLDWLHPPKAVTAHRPYILVAFADRVDAYNAGSHQVVQSVPTKGTPHQLLTISSVATTDTPPLVLTVTAPCILTLLRMKPLEDQLKTLLLTTRYADAVGIATLCPNECHLAPNERQDLHVKYALQLFQQHQFPAAFAQFLVSGTSGRHVISLFPEELLPRGYNLPRVFQVSPLAPDSLPSALAALVAYLEGLRKSPTDVSRDDAVLFDTVLLKAYVLTHSPALTSFCSTPNAADLGEAELFLRGHSEWESLLAFYKCHAMHRKALQLLEELDMAHPGQYESAMVRYLQSLSDVALVMDFSTRLLVQNPELGLTIFTRRDVPSDLDSSVVLQHLKAIETTELRGSGGASAKDGDNDVLPLENGRALAISYLTQRIYSNDSELPSALHDELVYLLFDAIETERHKSKTSLHARVHLQRDRLGVLRKQLLAFLQSPLAMYHPERLLSRTPMDLLEERAVLLANMGRHEEVLRLYLHDLRDAALAETYCNECYAHHITDASIYTLFLQTYLRPPRTAPAPRSSLLGSIGLHFVAAFMLRHAHCIDVATALELLPPTLEAAAISAYLQRVLELKVEKRRAAQVEKQLLKIENLHVRDALNRANRESIFVDLDSTCGVCGRGLTRGPILHCPEDGALVHYACQSGSAAP